MLAKIISPPNKLGESISLVKCAGCLVKSDVRHTIISEDNITEGTYIPCTLTQMLKFFHRIKQKSGGGKLSTYFLIDQNKEVHNTIEVINIIYRKNKLILVCKELSTIKLLK